MFNINNQNVELVSQKVTVIKSIMNEMSGYGLFIRFDFVNKETNDRGYVDINVGFEQANDIFAFENREYHEDDTSVMTIEAYDTEVFICPDLCGSAVIKLGKVVDNKIKANINIDDDIKMEFNGYLDIEKRTQE
ncbi:MAG: hypothetical protein IKZ96_04160 [Bacilli bacterium]|nr:hypothetical protein [Bacilli bacterium]